MKYLSNDCRAAYDRQIAFITIFRSKVICWLRDWDDCTIFICIVFLYAFWSLDDLSIWMLSWSNRNYHTILPTCKLLHLPKLTNKLLINSKTADSFLLIINNIKPFLSRYNWHIFLITYPPSNNKYNFFLIWRLVPKISKTTNKTNQLGWMIDNL